MPTLTHFQHQSDLNVLGSLLDSSEMWMSRMTEKIVIYNLMHYALMLMETFMG